jgi:hypothetical protein
MPPALLSSLAPWIIDEICKRATWEKCFAVIEKNRVRIVDLP